MSRTPGRQMVPIVSGEVPEGVLNLLDLVPKIEVEVRRSEGRTQLMLPRRRPGLIRSIMKKLRGEKGEYFRLTLDDRGVAVVDLINGRRTVGRITKMVARLNSTTVDDELGNLVVFVQHLEGVGALTLNAEPEQLEESE